MILKSIGMSCIPIVTPHMVPLVRIAVGKVGRAPAVSAVLHPVALVARPTGLGFRNFTAQIWNFSDALQTERPSSSAIHPRYLIALKFQ